MLSIKRGLLGSKTISYFTNLGAPKSSINGPKNLKISKASGNSQKLVARYYARWSKVISKMSPGQLAKMRENSMANNRQGHSNISILTSNTVGDPWLAPRFSSPFAGKFWSDMLNWGKHVFMGYIASPWRIRSVANQLKVQKLPRSLVRQEAISLYIKYNETLSTFRVADIQPFTSDRVMKEVRNKYGKISLPSGSKSVWEHSGLSASILNFAVLQAPAPLNLHFIQATVRIKGSGKFVVYDQAGNIMFGKDEFKPLEDTWVIEKILEKPDLPWVIISTRLEHPDDVKAEAP